MSLRTKLALLLSGLTAVVVLIVLAVAWDEVRRAALITTEERLGRAVEQLGDLAAASTEERLRIKEAIGSDSTVRALLRGEAVDSAAVVRALSVLRAPSDSGLVVQVWDREAEPVFSDLAAANVLPASGAPLDTLPSYGHFRSHEGEVRYWSTAPVREEDGSILGWVVQERRIGNPAAAAQIEELIGPDTRVVFAIPDEPLAVTLSGDPVRAPSPVFPSDSLLVYEREGRTFLGRADSVPASPWALLVETPMSSVQARTAAFLDRMMLIAVLLILVTIAVGVLLGRRLTRPLEELVGASEAIAQGDGGAQVPVGGEGDELSRLGAAFNEMARRVSETHGELERRLRAQTVLARALEESTARAEKARLDAQEANRAKSDFLATMSHEVRTPINAILGYCDLLDLEMSGPLSPEQRSKVDRIRRSSRVLAALVEDVLDFAGLDSGRLRVETEISSVREAVLGAAAVVEPQSVAAGLTLEIDVPEGLTFVGDPGRVEQILVNLLTNAVKFTEEGRVVVRAARVPAPEEGGAGKEDGLCPREPPDRETPEHGWLRIDVRDTGVGISEGFQQRIFEPFVQEESGFTRRYGGTGLGLSISLELARMMDGDLTLSSRVDEGSCFTLWLPAAASEE